MSWINYRRMFFFFIICPIKHEFLQNNRTFLDLFYKNIGEYSKSKVSLTHTRPQPYLNKVIDIFTLVFTLWLWRFDAARFSHRCKYSNTNTTTTISVKCPGTTNNDTKWPRQKKSGKYWILTIVSRTVGRFIILTVGARSTRPSTISITFGRIHASHHTFRGVLFYYYSIGKFENAIAFFGLI